MCINKPAGCGNILNFIQINWKICEKMGTKVFDFSYNCELEKKVRIIQSDIKMKSLADSIIITSWKEISLKMSEYMSTFKMY